MQKHIFGPILSRRFGKSLGIDLSSSLKQCNFDCLYCELSSSKTVSAYTKITPFNEIIKELDFAIKKHNNIDIITITANGEPTLYPQLDKLLLAIKQKNFNISTLILTNSANIYEANIIKTLMLFDEVKLSLDSAIEDTFVKLDRPHSGIKLNNIIDGMKIFSQNFKGKLYIEILIVEGLNDTIKEIKALNTILLTLKNITRIDLSSVDRPPAYPIEAIKYKKLYELSLHFDPNLPIHIVSRQNIDNLLQDYSKEDIINTLDKRPLTKEDIQILFSNEAKINLEYLLQNKTITIKKINKLEFYILSKNNTRVRKK